MRFIQTLLIGLLLSFAFQSCTFDNLDDDATLSGVITNYSDKGIPDAKVKVKFMTQIVETTTDSEGKYFISSPYKGAAEILFEKNGYITEKVYMGIVGGNNPSMNKQLQAITPELVVDFPDQTVDNNAGTLVVKVTTNMDYTAQCNQYWVKMKKDKNYVTIDYEKNTLDKTRIAQVEIKCGGLRHIITITQSGDKL